MQEQEKKKNYKRRMLIVLGFLILFAIYSFVNLRGEYLEILEIGEEYLSVFWQNLKYKFVVIAINFVILFFSIYFTTRAIKKGLKEFFDEEKKEMPKLPNKSIALIASVVISIAVSNLISNKAILAFSNTLFEKTDPIFNLDIAYFMFQKPFIETILLYFATILIALTIYIAAYYITVFNIYFDGINRETLKRNMFIKQLTNHVMAIACIIAFLILVKSQDVVFQNFLTLKDEAKTELVGAGTADIIIGVWGYRIFAIVLIVCTYLGIHNFKKKKTKNTIISIVAIPSYLVVLFIVMSGFQLIFIGNNELEKEKDYIFYNIDRTKSAYNIQIEEKELENSGTVTKEMIEQNAEIIDNIPIVSEDATVKTLAQYQTNVGYYSYNHTKLGLYNIDGRETLAYVSPREIVSGGDRTYSNKTYEYTHGYGVILSYANRADSTGKIEYIQKEVDGKDEKIEITQPRIYYGLETNEIVVTNTKNTSEYDYPINSYTNAENEYDGEGGINLGFFDRLIIGITNGDVKLAVSTNIQNDSKILTNRNVIQRAKTIMPYLLYDDEPYMLIREDGSLAWVLDAYTTSNAYPYAQGTVIEQNGVKTKINYIRNSIKVIIDAYDGTTTFYLTDKTDPIAMAYWRVYPEIFADINQETIPEDIAEHIVYPEFLYQVQAEMITRYHNIQAEVLYRNDDVWEIAKSTVSKTSSLNGIQMEPYYTMVKNSENENNLGLIIPYTPLEKQNIISYLVGTYENNQNTLVLYRFSSGSSVVGPMQLNSQIEQDKTISNELEDLNVSGARLIKNMMIIPVEDTLLYVEPVYQVLVNESQVPILKKVIVASGTKVTIGNNLEEALTNLFSQYAIDIEVQNTENIEEIMEAIIKANNNLEESSASQDWELIGKDLKRLQELIKQLEQIQEEQKEGNEEITGENTAVSE